MVPRRAVPWERGGGAPVGRHRQGAGAARATQRRSRSEDARTQKRVQRNLDYHIARLEEETRRMSTEADALNSRSLHLKRVQANHRRAAGALDTLAWLLEHAEAFRVEAASEGG